MTLHLSSLFLASIKQQKLPLKAAAVAMQETAAPKHTDFLSVFVKIKAGIFVFVTKVIISCNYKAILNNEVFGVFFQPVLKYLSSKIF